MREFARYCTQSVLGMLGLSCYILADTYFIAKGLGAQGLAALNLAIPVYSLIHGCGLMLGMGGGTKYAIKKAQGDEQGGGRWFTDTLCPAAALAVLFLLAGLFCSQGITALLGADTEVFSMTETYLRVILLFAPAFLCNDILICFVRNDGAPRLSMLAMLGGSFCNILLDYVFIFPLGMGLFGAVLATGLAPVVSMLILSLHWLRGRSGLRPAKGPPRLSAVRAIFSLGLPSLVTEVSSGIVIIAFNFILLELLGNVGVAAYGVIANLSLVVVAIFTGLAQGMQPLVSRAFGRGEEAAARRVLRYALSAMLAIALAVYLSVFLFAGPIAGTFNSQGDPTLQRIAVYGLRIYFLAAPFVGFNIVVSMYFTSVGRALPAHLVSVLRGLVLILPLAFLLTALMGVSGVWLALPATEGAVSILSRALLIKIRKPY